jgi:hypothetical protein
LAAPGGVCVSGTVRDALAEIVIDLPPVAIPQLPQPVLSAWSPVPAPGRIGQLPLVNDGDPHLPETATDDRYRVF